MRKQTKETVQAIAAVTLFGIAVVVMTLLYLDLVGPECLFVHCVKVIR